MACYSQVRIGLLIFSGYAVNCSSFRVSEFNPCFSLPLGNNWLNQHCFTYPFHRYILQYLNSWYYPGEVSLDNFYLITDLPASVFGTSTFRVLNYADCCLYIQCSVTEWSYFVQLSFISCVCMSACRPTQGDEKWNWCPAVDSWPMILLSTCRPT